MSYRQLAKKYLEKLKNIKYTNIYTDNYCDIRQINNTNICFYCDIDGNYAIHTLNYIKLFYEV